jgi:hypothetical protein
MAELVYLFLVACNNDMPQCRFNNIEGADVTFLETVLLAESPPALYKLAATLDWDTPHLPR